MQTVHILVAGQVQGVFFRHTTKREAEKLGLVGWAKNNADGSVEIEAQGQKENLEEFVGWCKEGPTFAKVEKINVRWINKVEKYDSFEIIR